MRHLLSRLLENERWYNRLGWTVVTAWMLSIGAAYGFIVRAIIYGRNQ